ncbi:MAG: IS110 family transposase [Fibromonadaceae bacterium]|nr:IS110 family transposase [Fibromonadaceae bacterium]
MSLAKEIYPKQFRLLQSITGIGDLTAAQMLFCTKGMDAPSSRQLASFAGLVPSVNLTEEAGLPCRLRHSGLSKKAWHLRRTRIKNKLRKPGFDENGQKKLLPKKYFSIF